jgi:F-type H+-transporting ATPase subunit delta
LAENYSLFTEVSKRYANSLFGASQFDKSATKPEAMLDELRNFYAAFLVSRELRAYLMNPVVTCAQKVQAVGAIAKTLKLSKTTLDFIAIALENKRLDMLDEIIDELASLVRRARGESLAIVKSAAALDKDQKIELVAILEKKFKTKIELENRIDPSILGGITVKVASEMVDMSLSTKLTRLKNELINQNKAA